jgi:hypothetical protein
MFLWFWTKSNTHTTSFYFQIFDRENLANFFKNKFEFVKITLETEHFFPNIFNFGRGVKKITTICWEEEHCTQHW